MTTKIGIDAGGTLTKIAVETNERIHLLKFPSTDIERTAQWLTNEAPQASLALTGGKAGKLRELLAAREALLVPEFDATCIGASWLLEREGRKPAAFLLTNVGTGTSIHYVSESGHERVGGTGVGGGTIVGLSLLIGGSADFTSITAEALTGNRANVDLKVSHIYAGLTPPIPGDLTASNFGHVMHQTAPIATADALASVIGLVGETVTTVSVHAAREKGTTNIVYIGTTFVDNPLLADIVLRYTRLRGCEAYVLPDGGFSGAVGALLAVR